MEVKLCNELNDQQAEKASGGGGIEKAVSTTNEVSRELGFQNSNQLISPLVSRALKNYSGTVGLVSPTSK